MLDDNARASCLRQGQCGEALSEDVPGPLQAGSGEVQGAVGQRLVRPRNGRTSKLTRVERSAVNSQNRRSHGLSSDPLYSTWRNMRRRTTAVASYVDYGIGVHPRWHDLLLFVWDIVHSIGRPSAGRTLDRIDNSKGYEPGNVRWATRAEQARNRGHSKGPAWLDSDAGSAHQGCLYSISEKDPVRPVCEWCPFYWASSH